MTTLVNYFKISLLLSLFAVSATANAQNWTVVTTDAKGDGATPAYLDAIRFEYVFLRSEDSVYFRITVDTITPLQAINWGANVMINQPGQGTFNFWGTSNNAKWTKLITIKVSGTPPSSYTGTIGVANSIGVNQQDYTNLSANTINIVVDTVAKTIVLGMDRKDLLTNSDMAGNRSITLITAAAVGTSSSWNDDIYTPQGTMTLDSVNTGLFTTNINRKGALKVYPNPASAFTIIELPTIEAVNTIIITDVLGREVTNYGIDLIAENTAQINTENMAEGIYQVVVQTIAGNAYSMKFAVTE